MKSVKNILGATTLAIASALILGCPKIAFAADSQQPTPTTQHYSVREIDLMFRRPKSAKQLLRNLKLAYDRNLLVQPAFFDGDVLKQFFSGSAITGPDTDAIVDLDARFFPGMSVRVHQIKNPIAGHNAPGTPHEFVPPYAEIRNFVEIDTGSTMVISVRQIKDIFGDEFQGRRDLGEDSDGHSHIPTTKGSLQYTNLIRGLRPEEFHQRVALFVVKKDLVEGPRFIPANQPKNHCGLRHDDIIESMFLSEFSTES
jgi:hypothetical protein